MRYIPIIQKPYCCAMACMCMILFRHTGKLYDQEKLARYFGVRISPDVQSAFSEKMPLFAAQNFDEGVTTLSIVGDVQKVLDEAGISSHVRAHQFESAEILEQEIINTLYEDGDIWCEFVDGPISIPQELCLHDNLIESYDPETQLVTLIDPAGNKKNRYNMLLSELAIRMSGKYGRQTGILTFKIKQG